METQDCSSLQEDRTTFDMDLFNCIMQEPPDIDLVSKSSAFRGDSAFACSLSSFLSFCCCSDPCLFLYATFNGVLHR
jgi:hypothetical protein